MIENFALIDWISIALLSAFGMVGTFLVISDLKPWGKPNIFDMLLRPGEDLQEHQFGAAIIGKNVPG